MSTRTFILSALLICLLSILAVLAWRHGQRRVDERAERLVAEQPAAPVAAVAPPATPPPAPRPRIAAAPLTGDAALAQKICRGGGNDGAQASLFGHHRYAQASAGALTAAPDGFGGGNCTQIHGDMAQSLKELLAAAQGEDAALGVSLRGISCYRAIPRQAGLFCNPRKIASRGYAGQAKWVAPPGFSEHSTGYAIDFGARDGRCDVQPCFAGTPQGRWLAANASRFGFELSFPQGNAQGVSYEPWHYRWVGNGAARGQFAGQ
ncbi:MAG: M15 family metallopeptidase [Sphingopyxis sp.]